MGDVRYSDPSIQILSTLAASMPGPNKRPSAMTVSHFIQSRTGRRLAQLPASRLDAGNRESDPSRAGRRRKWTVADSPGGEAVPVSARPELKRYPKMSAMAGQCRPEPDT